jgi:hypothetical protein
MESERSLLKVSAVKIKNYTTRNYLAIGSLALVSFVLHTKLNKLFDLIFRLKGSVENVVISGASNFKVDSVKTDLVKFGAEVNISLDAAKVVGEKYVIEGDILNGALPLWGEGPFL